jgi:tripartite-type tricarboxylate transporter receptor subunit TctC
MISWQTSIILPCLHRPSSQSAVETQEDAMTLPRRQFLRLAAGAAALTALSQAASAQVYPSRTIKFVVPSTPGSPTDAAARLVAQHLQTRIGQSVIIENRPAAGTTIGVRAVANAAADGYTLLFMAPNIAYYPVLYPNLDFDPVKSLIPVATAVTWSHVVVVAPSVPAKTIAELIAYAKLNPGKLVFGFGLGTPPHLLGETLRQSANIDIASIPYRGGDQARTDLLGGRVHINIAPVASLLPLIEDGKVRPLAFTGPERSPDLPDVPTMIESGLPNVGFNPDVWQGIFAPAGTPPAVVQRLNREVNEVLKTSEMKATLAKLGFEPKVSTPEEFAAFFAAELKKWPPLLRAAGLKAQ